MKSILTITRISKSSWFKINYRDKIIHIDPGYAGFYENQDIPEHELNGDADYIFISHEHKDHMQEDAIEKIRGHQTLLICSMSCSSHLSKRHEVILPHEAKIFDDFTVQTIYAYNTEDGHSTKKFHPKDTYLGFIFSFDDVKVYFAGDTDMTDDMKELENIDIAMLPIGGTYVMDLDEAVEATKILKPAYVIPMHHANNSLEIFKDKVEKLTDTQTIVLYNGDSYTFFNESS